MARNGDLVGADVGTPTTIAGREAYVRDAGGACTVKVVQRHYMGSTGNIRNDVLNVVVRSSVPDVDVCGQAGALASEATPRLP